MTHRDGAEPCESETARLERESKFLNAETRGGLAWKRAHELEQQLAAAQGVIDAALAKLPHPTPRVDARFDEIERDFRLSGSGAMYVARVFARQLESELTDMEQTAAALGDVIVRQKEEIKHLRTMFYAPDSDPRDKWDTIG